MRHDGLGTAVQLAGCACIVWAGFIVATWLGLVTLGAVLLPAGHILDGFDAKEAWNRRRGRKRLKKVA